MTEDSQTPREDGLMASLHHLAHTVLRLVATRLEIFATEFGEERFNLTKLVLVALVVLFCLQMSLVLGVVFLVLAISTEHRVAAVGISAVVLLLGAVGGALWLRGWLKSRPPMFAVTIAELRKDRERLRGET